MNKETRSKSAQKPHKKDKEWSWFDFVIPISSIIIVFTMFLFFIPLDGDERVCPLKYIQEGEDCTMKNSYKGYCEQFNKTTVAMREFACICKDYKLICLEDLA